MSDDSGPRTMAEVVSLHSEPDFVRPGELSVDDAKTLTRLISLMREEMRTGFQILNEKIDRRDAQREDALDDLNDRVTQFERRPRAVRKK